MKLWMAVAVLCLASAAGACGARSDLGAGGGPSTSTSSSGGSPTSSGEPCLAGCDDGLACTVDVCEPTGCAHLVACDDGIACTIDTCGPSGCTHAPHDDACDDGVPCTTDSCGPSGCTHTPHDDACDDGIGCTFDACEPTGCVHAPADALCEDGALCTVDTCVPGAGCEHAPSDAVCDDGIACTIDTCDDATDTCRNVPCDSQCDDAVFCDGVERCDAAVGCVSGAPACQLGLSCSVDACSEASAQCTHKQGGACGPGTRLLVCDHSGALLSISPFGGPSITVAPAGAKVWFDVAILDGRWFALSATGYIHELWPQTNQTKTSFPVPSANSLGAGPDGFLYAASQTVYRINPDTGAVTTLGSLPPGYSSSGDVAFVDGQMFVSVDGPCGGALVEVDLAGGAAAVVGGDGLGCVYGLAVSGQTMFVVNCNGTVGTFDPASGVVEILSTTGVSVYGAELLP